LRDNSHNFKHYINNCELFNVQARDEFQMSSSELTVDKLIDSLVQSKTTGTQKPGISFVCDIHRHI